MANKKETKKKNTAPSKEKKSVVASTEERVLTMEDLRDMDKDSFDINQTYAVNVSDRESRKKSQLLELFLFLLMIGALIASYYFINSRESRDSDRPNDQGSSADSGNGETDGDDQLIDFPKDVLTLEHPVEGDIVAGNIFIDGAAARNIPVVKVEIFDDTNSLVGFGETPITTDSVSPLGIWAILLNITSSPKSEGGVLKVYPADAGVDSPLALSRKISFGTTEAEGRVIVRAPMSNQIIRADSVLFRGEIKGFFEGVAYFKLTNESGETLVKGFVEAKADNYKDFVPFEKEVLLGELGPNLGSKGEWVVYEISPRDGSEQVILRVPVLFKGAFE